MTAILLDPVDELTRRTVITGEPKRVVTVGVTEQDFMLALGFVPVATTRFRPDVYPGEIYPWAADELGDAAPPEAVEYGSGYNFEKIASLRPDLILGLYAPITEDDYDTLAEIAPTVAQPVEYPDFGVPWQELTRIVGRIFGRAERADQSSSPRSRRGSRKSARSTPSSRA